MIGGNLYASVDDSRRRHLEDTLKRLRHTAGYFAATRVSEPLAWLGETFFPENMPGRFYAANTSLDGNSVLLALRPVLGDRTWPFPSGRSLCVRGIWRAGLPDPVFHVDDVIEISDAPRRPFEIQIDVFTYQVDRDVRARRTNNILSTDLVASLPRISETTARRLQEWTDYLAWKRKLVIEKSRGLRYTRRRLTGSAVVFTVVGPDRSTLERQFEALRRQDLAAFELGISIDAWTLKLNDQAGRTTRPVELGAAKACPSAPAEALEGCPWPDPSFAELKVELPEELRDEGQRRGNPDELARILLDGLPAHGFVAVPSAGDFALIKRHERALQDLRDQGGYAPYLAAYLFDVTKANRPVTFPSPEQWHRDDLNPKQREAVRTILAAPDLCLIQGPPGTGKTTVIAEATYQLVKAGKKVLLASQAHTAVDNVLERLGNVPEIRGIRLGNARKFKAAGQEFAEDQVLARYYGTVADACERKHLAAWKADDDAAMLLEDWLARARPAHADFARDARALDAARSVREAAAAAVRAEEQRLSALRSDNEDRLHVRARLHALTTLLDGGDPTGAIEVVEPEASRLIEALAPLAGAGFLRILSPTDWHLAPGARAEGLVAAVKRWRAVPEDRTTLLRDAERLRAAGEDPLLDPAVKLRLGEINDQFHEAQLALAHDPGVYPRWKALHAARTALEGTSGGLDRAFYGSRFVGGAELTTRTRASEALDRVEELLRVVDEAQPSVTAALEALRAASARAHDATAPPTIDTAPLQGLETDLRARTRDVEARSERVTHRHSVLHRLLDELATVKLPPVRTFDEALEASETRLADIRARQESTRSDRATWEGILRDWVRDLRSPEARRADQTHFIRTYLKHCNVVAITCNENSRTLEERELTHFDVAIVDEVSKATPTELLLPLMRARTAVLVGDHRQLPPLFKEGLESVSWADVAPDDDDQARTALTRENLRRFEKMVTSSLFKEHFEKAPDDIRARLEVQFRMHPQIMDAVNHFYDKRLTCGLAKPDDDRAHGLELRAHDGERMLTPNDHIAWFDTSYDPAGTRVWEDQDERGQSLRTNRLEALLIAETLAQLETASLAAGWSETRRRNVGVVSFYADQLRMIRDEIRNRKLSFRALQVEIDTVIRYQGKEKPIVLVSLVRNFHGRPSNRSNIAQYQFINVAFSRAQQLLLVFGARELYQRCAIELPNMDAAGSETKEVYRYILEELQLGGRLIPSSRLLSPETYARLTHDARPGAHRRAPAPRGGGR